MKYLIVYLLLINALAFVLMLTDKWKAVKHRWRIPERMLLLTAALGGSVGALAGMYLVRHKTRHFRFRFGIPAMLALQLLAAFWLWHGGLLGVN